jgi:pentatricopeptide repeat protein
MVNNYYFNIIKRLMKCQTIQKKYLEVIETFNDLKKTIEPNEKTFVSVMNACVHLRDHERIISYLNEMLNVYYLKPSVISYSCLINCLIKQKKIDESFEIAEVLISRGKIK